MPNRSAVAATITENRDELLQSWLGSLRAVLGDTRITEAELNAHAAELLRLITDAIRGGGDIKGDTWADVRRFLEDLSRSRATQGFSSAETATFVFSLKRALFDVIRTRLVNDPLALAEATWESNELVDALGLHTVQTFQKSREDVVRRQQEDMLELSTPVVRVWDGILVLPMIGTLDSARTQIVMETLLQRIVETGSEVAIIDITGVPTVDTLVAQHLLKTVTAIRLMGADCIISGIRPQIAQTIVHLGVDLGGVTTKASLADALAVAFDRSGLMVVARRS